MDQQTAADRGELKLLIASTPKTGNTWVKNLLGTLYRLPIVDLDPDPDPDHWASLGPRWIAHQHYFPTPYLLAALAALGVTAVTTVRHPGDVLVSLYHYVRAFADTQSFDDDLRQAMIAPDPSRDPLTVDDSVAGYVRDHFAYLLAISADWLREGASHRVRYEDLWRDPVAALGALAEGIWPASNDALERAVDQCDIDVMRRRPGTDPRFYRRGGVGDWQAALPPGIIALLVAFVSGAVVMNSAIMELPTEKDGRFLPFLAGALIYGVILLPLG